MKTGIWFICFVWLIRLATLLDLEKLNRQDSQADQIDPMIRLGWNGADCMRMIVGAAEATPLDVNRPSTSDYCLASEC